MKAQIALKGGLSMHTHTHVFPSKKSSQVSWLLEQLLSVQSEPSCATEMSKKVVTYTKNRKSA